METILVVDDELAIRLLYQEEFTDQGYKVLTAANALDGLDIIENKQVDLVILDIKMPGMDGLEALKKIAALNKGVPIILNSAFDYKDDFITWPCRAYVIKSQDLTELKETVKSFLSGSGKFNP